MLHHEHAPGPEFEHSETHLTHDTSSVMGTLHHGAARLRRHPLTVAAREARAPLPHAAEKEDVATDTVAREASVNDQGSLGGPRHADVGGARPWRPTLRTERPPSVRRHRRMRRRPATGTGAGTARRHRQHPEIVQQAFAPFAPGASKHDHWMRSVDPTASVGRHALEHTGA
eukprot:6574534-Prymnesium_polylepis.1